MSNNEVTSGIVSCVVDKINQHLEKSGRSYYRIGLLLTGYTQGKGPDYEKRFIRDIAVDKRIKCRKSTIYNCFAVVRFFPDYTPDDPLSFSHHVELTRLDHQRERLEFKEKAIKGNWSVRKLAAAVHEHLDEIASAEKRLEKCLGCLKKSLDLLCGLEAKKLAQLAKGTVVAAAVVANAADEVAKKAETVSGKAKKYSERLRKQWEQQLLTRRTQDRKSPGIVPSRGLEPCDYRLIGVPNGTDCKSICFPKDKPETDLLNVFRAAKHLLHVNGLPDVRLQYRPKKWATYWNMQKMVIQFGQGCLEGQFREGEEYRCRTYDRLGAKPGLDYVALTVMEEVTHAALDSERGPQVSPHGRDFRLKLDEIYHEHCANVVAILGNDGHSKGAPATPAEPPSSTDVCDSAADERR